MLEKHYVKAEIYQIDDNEDTDDVVHTSYPRNGLKHSKYFLFLVYCSDWNSHIFPFWSVLKTIKIELFQNAEFGH